MMEYSRRGCRSGNDVNLKESICLRWKKVQPPFESGSKGVKLERLLVNGN